MLATYLFLKTQNEHGRVSIDFDILIGRTAQDPHLNVNVELADLGGGGPILPDTARKSR